MTTVKQLRDILNDLDDDLIILLSRDPEGNGFHRLSKNLSINMFDPNKHYIDELKELALDDKMREMGYTDEDIGTKDDVQCLVLWAE